MLVRVVRDVYNLHGANVYGVAVVDLLAGETAAYLGYGEFVDVIPALCTDAALAQHAQPQDCMRQVTNEPPEEQDVDIQEAVLFDSEAPAEEGRDEDDGLRRGAVADFRVLFHVGKVEYALVADVAGIAVFL